MKCFIGKEKKLEDNTMFYREPVQTQAVAFSAYFELGEPVIGTIKTECLVFLTKLIRTSSCYFSSLLPSAFALWASLCYQGGKSPCSIVQRRWQRGWQTRQQLLPMPRFHLLETCITMYQRSRLGEWKLFLRYDLELQTSRTWYLKWLGSQVDNWWDSCGVN